jgi:phosphoribosylformylglycinamidine synthase
MAQETDKFNASCGRHLNNCPTFKNCSPGKALFHKIPPLAPRFWGAKMKAKIIITPKKAVVDPQGKTVQSALEQMGYQGVAAVHVGKYIEIDLAPGTDKAAAQQALNDAAHKFLSNPIIEDYKLEIE